MAVVEVHVAAFEEDPHDKQIPAVVDKKNPAEQVT
jgi:hypothetical protein